MSKKARERSLADNEAQAVARVLRTSSQKLNLVCQSIRGRSAEKALAELTFPDRARHLGPLTVSCSCVGAARPAGHDRRRGAPQHRRDDRVQERQEGVAGKSIDIVPHNWGILPH